MRVNNIGHVNFKGSEVENSEKGNINPPKETKEAPASISDALCTYGKAQVRMNGTSFTGNIRRDKQSDIKLKELTDEEFEKYKAKLGKKIKAMPNDVKKEAEIWFRCLNKTNIFLADKILSDERFCGNKNFMENAGSIIYDTKSKMSADKAIGLIDKCDKEGFLDNKAFVSNLETLLTDTLKGTNE